MTSRWRSTSLHGKYARLDCEDEEYIWKGLFCPSRLRVDLAQWRNDYGVASNSKFYPQGFTEKLPVQFQSGSNNTTNGPLKNDGNLYMSFVMLYVCSGFKYRTAVVAALGVSLNDLSPFLSLLVYRKFNKIDRKPWESSAVKGPILSEDQWHLSTGCKRIVPPNNPIDTHGSWCCRDRPLKSLRGL